MPLASPHKYINKLLLTSQAGKKVSIPDSVQHVIVYSPSLALTTWWLIAEVLNSLVTLSLLVVLTEDPYLAFSNLVPSPLTCLGNVRQSLTDYTDLEVFLASVGIRSKTSVWPK